jgi:hypothetical protein
MLAVIPLLFALPIYSTVGEAEKDVKKQRLACGTWPLA